MYDEIILFEYNRHINKCLWFFPFGSVFFSYEDKCR